MIQRAIPFLCAYSSIAAQFLPDLEFSELLIRPHPGDHQRIELITTSVVDTSGFQLVVGNTAVALPGVVLGFGAVCVLHLGVAGTNSPAALYLPNAPAMGIADSVALFRDSQFHLPSSLIEYVGWNGATGPHAAIAVQAGRWSATSESAALPAAVGSSLANRRETRTVLNVVGPMAWYDDTTPTFGSENDPAMTWAHGVGCVTANAPGFGNPGGLDPGPWLGEYWRVTIAPVSSFALVVASTTPTAPVYLDFLGMPFCFANIAIEWTAVVPYAYPYTEFGFTVPASPQFVDYEWYLQALVPDPAAGNAIGAQVTGSLRAHVGSR